jgi:hypothetical protein
MVLVSADRPHGAGGGDEPQRAGRAEEGGAVTLADVSDGHDGKPTLVGEPGERREHFADDRVKVGVAVADVGVDRIDDDQTAIAGAVHRRLELGEVVAEVGDGGQKVDAVRIGPGRVESGADGVGEVVFGGKDQHRAGSRERGAGSLNTRVGVPGFLLFRPGGAAGDPGGHIEGDETLAQAGVADQERYLAERDAIGPQPLDGLGRKSASADHLDVANVVVGRGIVVGDDGAAVCHRSARQVVRVLPRARLHDGGGEFAWLNWPA